MKHFTEEEHINSLMVQITNLQTLYSNRGELLYDISKERDILKKELRDLSRHLDNARVNYLNFFMIGFLIGMLLIFTGIDIFK